jgi:dipeptidyl aminopeptidase/acylaminoacyl peptidase
VRDGRTTPLVVSPDHEARPAFSPDGTKLAFSRWPAHGRSADATLWVANADGTTPIELTAAPAPATHPAWSPDGRALAFQHRVATGWEIWSLALPADIARTGHLRLAQQVRGGADVDTAKLRSADTVRGTVEETTFKVRAAYGALVLPRAAVASILFGSGERGLARVVLVNGDTVTGFLENEGIAIAAGGRTQRLAVEQIEQLSLRAGKAPAGDASFRAVMRNGDSLLVSGAFGPLRLKVGNRPTDLDAKQVDRVEFTEGGEKATAVLVNGDSLTGQLGGGRLELVLAAGARVAVHPSTIRALVRAAVRPASMAGS